MAELIKGSVVALVTPMFEDGGLDLDTYRELVEFHIKNKTNGIVAVGTTGESQTVNFEEHLSLIDTAVKQ